MLTRKHHREHLQIHCRVLLAHPRDGLFTVLLEIPEQRTNYRLAQPVTRAAQSSGRVANLRPTIFNLDVAVLHITGLSQTSFEVDERASCRPFKRRGPKIADHRHRWLQSRSAAVSCRHL